MTSSGSPGSATDQHDARRAVVGVGRGQVPVAQRRRRSRRAAPRTCGARGCRARATVTPPWRPTAGVQARGPRARRRRARRRSGAPRRPRRPRALTSGSSVAAMTYHAPSRSRVVEVALVPGRPRPRQALDRRRDLGGDDDDVGARGDQRRHPALGDVAAADHDDLATGQPQAGRGTADAGRPWSTIVRLSAAGRATSRGLAVRLGHEHMSLDRPCHPDPYDLLPAAAVLHGHQRRRHRRRSRSRTTRSPTPATPRPQLSLVGARPRAPRPTSSPASTPTRRRRAASGTGCWSTCRPT